MRTETRLIISTRQKIDGVRRKLGWFSRTATDLYFEVGGIFLGSHTSYHKDGNIFRTSPATGNRPSLEKRHLPLADFHGFHQLGLSMLRKSALSTEPPVKSRDQKGHSHLQEINLDAFPSEALNFVVELIEPDCEELLHLPELQPPPDAHVVVLRTFQPWVIFTTLGHDHNLLVRPAPAGFIASHFNSRFSANRPGQQYRYEAYKND